MVFKYDCSNFLLNVQVSLGLDLSVGLKCTSGVYVQWSKYDLSKSGRISFVVLPVVIPKSVSSKVEVRR